MSNKKSHKRFHSNHTPLDKHIKQGSQLIPPLATLPNKHLSSWFNEVLPEMLWAILIICAFNRDDALSIFRSAVDAISNKEVVLNGGRITHSALAQDQDRALCPFIRLLTANARIAAALSPLKLFPQLPGFEAWRVALPIPAEEAKAWEQLRLSAERCLDYHSQESTDCCWIQVIAALISKILVIRDKDFESGIINYPYKGDMRVIRPQLRCTEMALRNSISSSAWPEVFWKECFNKTECGPFYTYTPEATGLEVGLTMDQLSNLSCQVHSAYTSSLVDAGIDIRRDAVYGLAFFAVSILKELIRPGASSSIIGRGALRTLVEIAITLAYLINENDPEKWRQYRNYGVGKAKLSFLKQNDKDTPSFVAQDALNILANDDCWQEYTPIELGHWDKKDLRKMAESSGTKDLYDNYYDWTSHYGHGHWGAVRESVFYVCANPLHRLHRVLASQPPMLGDVLPDAAKVMERIIIVVHACYPEIRIDSLFPSCISP